MKKCIVRRIVYGSYKGSRTNLCIDGVLTMKRKLLAGLAMGVLLFVAPAYAINLNANFRLFGEVSRFGIGYGDMALHFGVNGPAAQIGSLGFIPGGIPFTTGVLSSVSLPSRGFRVVDTTFSVPFSLNIDQPASMYSNPLPLVYFLSICYK